MGIKVIQIRYFKDNFSYILYDEITRKGMIIDPCPLKTVVPILKEKQINLEFVTNTHTHPDHTAFNKEVCESGNYPYLSIEKCILMKEIALGSSFLKVIETPGHTADSVCFLTDRDDLITGDTLFVANVGNSSPANYKVFYNSLQNLMKLSDSTLVYPGHDYTVRSLNRVLTLNSSNVFAQTILEKYNPNMVVSSIGDEKKMNPYLRSHIEPIKNYLKEKNMAVQSEYQCFCSFITLF